jgi:L-arabinose transport system permease protein
MAAQATGSVFLAIGAGLIVGALCGLVNGIIITYGRVNAVIATLGTMAIFRGVAFILSDGQSISIFDEGFRFMGNGLVLGFPFPLWILAVTAVVFQIFLSQSIAVVARFSGINVNRYKVAIYMMSGFVGGLGGIILAARTGSGQPISGSQGLELEAITAAVLGGCALQGGRGTIVGALLGVLIIGVLNNGMILTAVPTFYQLLAKGALLILAVLVAEYRLNRA